MRFFFDNNLSPLLAEALDLLDEDHQVVPLRKKFHPSTRDIDWLTALGAEGDWIILSDDTRITRLPQEREVWLHSRLPAFFLETGWTNLDRWEIASKLIHWWPTVVAQAGRTSPGRAFFVPVRSQKLRPLV